MLFRRTPALAAQAQVSRPVTSFPARTVGRMAQDHPLLERAGILCIWLPASGNRAQGQPVLPRRWAVTQAHCRQGSRKRKSSQICGRPPPENRCCCSCCRGGCCCGWTRARCLRCCSTSRRADHKTRAHKKGQAQPISSFIHAPRQLPVCVTMFAKCSYCFREIRFLSRARRIHRRSCSSRTSA